MNFIENESAQKLRGGYYTPPDIAAFLTRWVLAGRPKRLLEPSCGDGVFFDAVSHVDQRTVKALVAFELDPHEAARARKRSRSLAGVDVAVHASDFLSWSLERIFEPPAFDGVIGNPPFIRYQYLNAELQTRSQKIFEHHCLPFTKHTNAWVPFVIASIAQLRPGGRLGMVVPAELLHVLHAQSLRGFLLAKCAKIVVLDPQELWFGASLQGVVLLLAIKSEDQAPQGSLAIVPVKNRQFLDEDPGQHFERTDFIPASHLPHKWMPALLTSRERSLLDSLREHPSVKAFREIADVDVGIVTGANKFFLVPDAVVEHYGLSRWAHPMFGRSEHVRGVIFDQRSHEENRALGFPSNFLWFGDRELSHFPRSVQGYLRDGERQGLHRRYKCGGRTPWYNVPSVSSAPVGMLKRSHAFPRLVLNKLRVLTTDTAYRVQPRRVSAEHLVYSFVNSLTVLTAELEGRHYGGGVLELVPSEIERVLIPLSPPPRGGLERLDEAVRGGTAPERVLLTQDASVLGTLGLTPRDSDALRSAWSRLRFRRQRIEALDSDEVDRTSGDLEQVGATMQIGAVNG